MQTSALKSKLSVTPERKENLEGFKLCRLRPVALGGRLFFCEVQALFFFSFFFKVPILGAGSGPSSTESHLHGVTAAGPHWPRLSLQPPPHPRWLPGSILGLHIGFVPLTGVSLRPGILPEFLASHVYVLDVPLLFACKTLTLLPFWTIFSTFTLEFALLLFPSSRLFH